MNNKKLLIFLFFILIVASFLRFWQIGKVPASVNWDEAALGYNSYSILTTGKDEYGQTLPFVLQSFGDFKPALYSYIAIPAIAILGLSPISVRLPSAIVGVLTVFAFYFLLKALFPEKFAIAIGKYKIGIAEIGTFLLAISPWHIQFSRVAYEANLAFFLNLLSLLFFIKSIRRPKLLLISVIFASLSIYTYQSSKIFIPLLFISLFVIFRKEILSFPRRIFFSSIVLGLIICLPMLIFTFGPNGLARARGASFLSNPIPVFNQMQADRLVVDKENGDIAGIILDNRRVVYAKEIIANYLSHYNPNWLFIEGDSITLRHQPPFMGRLYLWELPFIFLGIYFLLFGKFNKKIKYLIITWFVITPLPAAITWDVPNGVRTLNLIFPYTVFTSIGLIYFFSKVDNLKVKLLFQSLLKFIAVASISVIILISLFYYVVQYFVQYNYFSSQEWQYGYKELIQEVNKEDSSYDKIIISNNKPLDQSYIFFLFYKKYPPKEYLEKVNLTYTQGYEWSRNLDKLEFRNIKLGEEKTPNKNLYVIGAMDKTTGVKDLKVIKTINFLDGTPAFKLVQI